MTLPREGCADEEDGDRGDPFAAPLETFSISIISVHRARQFRHAS
jgi:hypothetical protein